MIIFMQGLKYIYLSMYERYEIVGLCYSWYSANLHTENFTLTFTMKKKEKVSQSGK